MRNAAQPEPSAPVAVARDEPELVYASDVLIMAESGGLQLSFTRPRAVVGDAASSSAGHAPSTEVIARVVLPPLAARRLLRLLPRRLDLQQALAEDYALATDVELAGDPFLAALEDAEVDDEPHTDEEKAAARAGRDAFARGEFATLDDVWAELVEEDTASTVSAP